MFCYLSNMNLYVPKVTDVGGLDNTHFPLATLKVADIGESASTLISPLTPKVTLISLSSPKSLALVAKNHPQIPSLVERSPSDQLLPKVNGAGGLDVCHPHIHILPHVDVSNIQLYIQLATLALMMQTSEFPTS